MIALRLCSFLALPAAVAQDCSGEGVTWGKGIGPPPSGCGAPTGTSGSATCTNPSCASPPCAAPLLGDVGCTTVSGVETYNHELLSAGHTIASNAHIYGPFEAGFTSQQQSIIENWGCSDASVAYDTEGGTDIGTAEGKVSHLCNIELPRIVGSTYYGVVGPCGGHTNDYHFHRSFSCLYSASGGHSTKVGVIAGHNIYGKWEDYDNLRLPLLDACGAHIGATPESSDPVYHYHVQDQAPFTVGCHGPSASGGLVSVATCRSLYSDCDDDGGSGTTIQLKTGSIAYDRFCPCFDATGSNMGTNIQELPALSSDAIYYTVDANSSALSALGSVDSSGDASGDASVDASAAGTGLMSFALLATFALFL
eukprot:Skav235847  [mRNA]  locus=scaffold1931:404324:405421:- [translate_table: standard]